MIARRIFFALTFAVMLITSTAVACAQSGESEPPAPEFAAQGGTLDVLERVKQTQAQRLEGTWVLTVSPAPPPGIQPPPPFHVYATLSRGGTYIGSDRSRPLDGPQHGTWTHLGGNQFAYGIIQDRFDVMGNFLGVFTGRTNATITGPDTFIGVGSVEFRDAAGNLVLARCATVRGERFKLQPLADQCQNVTPPQ